MDLQCHITYMDWYAFKACTLNIGGVSPSVFHCTSTPMEVSP